MSTERQYKLLQQLVKLFQPSYIFEIGSFTGGSVIFVASAHPSSSNKENETATATSTVSKERSSVIGY